MIIVGGCGRIDNKTLAQTMRARGDALWRLFSCEGEKMEWDRQAGESDKAYEAFKIYLRVRSLQKVYKELSKSRQVVSRWANKYDWRGRVIAYDRALEEEERRLRVEGRREELRKQRELGMALCEKALERVKTLEVEKITPYALVQMAEAAVKIMNEVSEKEGDKEEVTSIVIKSIGG